MTPIIKSVSKMKRNRINTPFCISLALLFGVQAMHGYEQSSYALFKIVADESAATVEDGRVPIERSIFETTESAAIETTEASPPTTGAQLDFTNSSFGGDTGSFGSTFEDFTTDTPNTTESQPNESFNLGVFGTER